MNLHVPLRDPYRPIYDAYCHLLIELTYRDGLQALEEAVNRELQLLATEAK